MLKAAFCVKQGSGFVFGQVGCQGEQAASLLTGAVNGFRERIPAKIKGERSRVLNLQLVFATPKGALCLGDVSV